MCCYDIIITLEHVGVCQNTFTGSHGRETWKKHDFWSEIENSGPDFRGLSPKSNELIYQKKLFFRTGSFLEQSYMYEVTQKNKKPILEHPQGSEIDEGIFSLR